jgi:hypothetical protein
VPDGKAAIGSDAFLFARSRVPPTVAFPLQNTIALDIVGVGQAVIPPIAGVSRSPGPLCHRLVLSVILVGMTLVPLPTPPMLLLASRLAAIALVPNLWPSSESFATA